MKTKSIELSSLEGCSNLAEIEISYKKKVHSNDLEKICSSNDANMLLRKVWSNNLEYIEEAYLICLNRANKVLGYIKLSSGGICGTVVDVRMILQIALKTNSVGIILSHNHPSGNNKPSETDIKLTRNIKEACKFMEIDLLDHVIITENEYFSFADNGIL